VPARELVALWNFDLAERTRWGAALELASDPERASALEPESALVSERELA
jgi:hypothetical protein